MSVTTKRIYRCNNCGKESVWTDDWMYKEVFYPGTFRREGWEETITVCSKDCAAAFDKARKIAGKEAK